MDLLAYVVHLRYTGMIRDIAYLRQGEHNILSDVLSALEGDIDIGQENYCHQCNMCHCGCIEPNLECPQYSRESRCKCREKGNEVNDPMVTILTLIDGKTTVPKSTMKVSLEDALLITVEIYNHENEEEAVKLRNMYEEFVTSQRSESGPTNRFQFHQ